LHCGRYFINLFVDFTRVVILNVKSTWPTKPPKLDIYHESGDNGNNVCRLTPSLLSIFLAWCLSDSVTLLVCVRLAVCRYAGISVARMFCMKNVIELLYISRIGPFGLFWFRFWHWILIRLP